MDISLIDLLQISALYVKKRGEGLGKILLDRIKSDHKYLHLWSHEFNNLAHKFYTREGFQLKNRKDRGSDGIPELQFEWIGK